MKTEIIDIDDTESNEDWIKEVTKKREAGKTFVRVVEPVKQDNNKGEAK